MAYTQLTVQTPGTSGTALVHANATISDGNKFPNDGQTYLSLQNPGASTAVVTVVTGATVNGLAVSDVTITLTTGQEKIAGPFPVHPYNQTSGTDVNCVLLTYSGDGAADVDVAAFR